MSGITFNPIYQKGGTGYQKELFIKKPGFCFLPNTEFLYSLAFRGLIFKMCLLMHLCLKIWNCQVLEGRIYALFVFIPRAKQNSHMLRV